MRRAEIDNVLERFASIRRTTYENGDLAALWNRALAEPDQLDPDESARVASLIDDFFITGLQVRRKIDEGVMEERVWTGIAPFFVNVLSTPGGKRWWKEWSRTPYPPYYAKIVEDMIGQDEGA